MTSGPRCRPTYQNARRVVSGWNPQRLHRSGGTTRRDCWTRALLDDPSADAADSSAAEGRLFEDDDPINELKAAGVIDSPSHPEMLGQLGRYAIEREIGSGAE